MNDQRINGRTQTLSAWGVEINPFDQPCFSRSTLEAMLADARNNAECLGPIDTAHVGLDQVIEQIDDALQTHIAETTDLAE